MEKNMEIFIVFGVHDEPIKDRFIFVDTFNMDNNNDK
jgi:hypothetical protein